MAHTLLHAAPAEGPDLSHVDWTKVARGCDTLPALIAHCADRHAATELVVFDGDRITYGDAFARSHRLAATLLAAGIGKGNRVGMLFGNGPEFTVAWLAIARIGAVAVPISTLSSPLELRRIIAASGMALLLAAPRYLKHDFGARIAAALEIADAPPVASAHAPWLRAVWSWSSAMPGWSTPIAGLPAAPAELVDAAGRGLSASDAISIIFTSGSMSAAKGVIHTHGSFLRSAQRWAASMDFRCGDRVLNTSPFFWVGGLVTALLTCMEVGATVVGSSGGPEALLDLIVDEGCTLVGTSALASKQLVQLPGFHSRDFSRVRASSVAQMLPPERRMKNQVYFGNALGMTETAGPHTLAVPDVDDDHVGSMGPLAPGMEHRLVDPATGSDVAPGERGELLVRGDTMMDGYVGKERSACFDADGWFHTGDLCSYRDGHLFLHSRLDGIIKVAGANVSLPEVEAALLSVDGVDSASAIGLKDPVRGESVAAIVVPAAGAPIDAGSVIGAMKELLSAYKVPRRVLVVDAIPLTATGKPDRREIEALFAG